MQAAFLRDCDAAQHWGDCCSGELARALLRQLALARLTQLLLVQRRPRWQLMHCQPEQPVAPVLMPGVVPPHLARCLAALDLPLRCRPPLGRLLLWHSHPLPA